MVLLKKFHFIISFISVLFIIHNSEGLNKYSEKVNKPKPKTMFSPQFDLTGLRKLDKPFRMHKLNLVWIKARSRLTDSKLQSLFSDLKIHDKEELTFKHMKSDGKDQTGLEEARLRKKLIGIMTTYNLLEHFEDTPDPMSIKKYKPYKDLSNYIVKNIFKDKRLNQLWGKAERAGFTYEELEALKEEFDHHQDKVDEYMSLLTEFEAGDPNKEENSIHEKPESWNAIENEEEISNDVSEKEKDYLSRVNLLKEKHLEVRSGYDHLEAITAKGPNHKEFTDPKVQDLWGLARDSQFSPQELASLKQELYHYEQRLIKLRHLHIEKELEAARNGKDYKPNATYETYLKLHAEHVDKIHKDIEFRIMQKHTEL